MNSTEKRPAARALVPVVIIIIGILLMIGKIVADSEPGAIPILLILVGVGWYVAVRMRSRPHQS